MLKCPPTQLSQEFQKPPFPVLRPSKAGKLGVFKSRKFVPIQEQLCLPNSPPSHYLSLSGQDLMEIQTAGNISVVSFSLSTLCFRRPTHLPARSHTHVQTHTAHIYCTPLQHKHQSYTTEPCSLVSADLLPGAIYKVLAQK